MLVCDCRQRQRCAAHIGLVHAAQARGHEPAQTAGAEGQGLEEAVLHLGEGAGIASFRRGYQGLQFRP